MARGGRRVRASARGTASAGAARAHGERREGDEGEMDEQQRLTESGSTSGHEEEGDTEGKKPMAIVAYCLVLGTAHRTRK